MAVLGYYSFEKILKILRDWQDTITNIQDSLNNQQLINTDIYNELSNAQQRDDIQIRLMFI